jgi:uncharacterized membrane protein
MASNPQPPADGGLTENMACALCYLLGLITGVVFLVLAPYNQNPRVKFHAWQSILTHLAIIILFWAVGISAVMLAFMGMGALVALLWPILGIGSFVGWLFLMYKAYNGDNLAVPVVSGFARKQSGFTS